MTAGRQRDSAGFMSPRGFLAAAVVFAGLYGVAHLAGLRAYTSILSGTDPAAAGPAALGLLYTLLYFGAVLGAPILILGAAILWGLSRGRG